MDQDQISHLPRDILHDILSRLPGNGAARMSVLSKKWAETWSTFPILSFSDTKVKAKDFVRKRKEFLAYIRKTFLRFHDQGLAIKEFKLSLDNHPYKSRVINLWMKLACESGVEVLELHLPTEQYYVLPRFVLEAKSLNKLALNGGKRVYLPFLNQSIKFLSLRVLSLYLVFFEDHHQAIQHLISCCPLIEHIFLRFDYLVEYDDEGRLLLSKMYGMKSLDMRGLPKLKKVNIQGVQEVYIDSPNLDYLFYIPADISIPCLMDFNRCRNLRCLYLFRLPGRTITSKWFLELFIKTPFLECLILNLCTMSQKIDISSGQLKVLEFLGCFNLEEANIIAPNLLSCVCRCYDVSKPIISFLKCSSQLEVKVWIQVDFPDLRNLREIIQNLRPQNVISLSLFIRGPILDEGNLYVLQVSPPLQSIKHLHLSARPKEESFYFSLVNTLLSSRAATISLSLDTSYWSRAFIEIFYEALMGRKEEDNFCCHLTKCWCHDLKDFRVTNSTTDEQVDFKTLLDTLPAHATVKNISFRLEF